jgi:RluA family pseudouridine synthase
VQSRQLETGDVIDVLHPAAELGCPARPGLPAVELLHEDSWLVAADKPAGILSQPAATSRADERSFDQLLLLHLAVRDGRRPFVRLVHRLDRATSGVLLFATHSEALPPLDRAWREGRVARHYLAVVAGASEADELELDQPIARDPSHSWRFRVAASGKPARTRVRTLATAGDGTSLLLCSLGSGRTHQVRVHLAAAGMPVLGDRLYGAPQRAEVGGLMLHALSLDLPHPRTAARLRIDAPLPPRFGPFVPAAARAAIEQEIGT